jgi:hypothetical protein
MRAIFRDNDGRWTYVQGETEYDLGFYRPGKYIWAEHGGNRQQVCNGGGWRGNTLSWPGGKVLGYHDALDRLGRPMSVPEYADLPDDEVLKWLGKALGAHTYKSRASYGRYYSGCDTMV